MDKEERKLKEINLAFEGYYLADTPTKSGAEFMDNKFRNDGVPFDYYWLEGPEEFQQLWIKKSDRIYFNRIYSMYLQEWEDG